MTTPIDPRITPSVLARLRALPARARNALLVLLAAGGVGGGVIVTRDREPTRPPPVTEPPVRPPPTDPGTRPPPVDPGTRPPPTATWPTITETKTKDFEHHSLPQSSVGIKYTVTVPDGHTVKMVTLLDYGGTTHNDVLIDNCWIETHDKILFGRRGYNLVDAVVRKTKCTGKAGEHYFYDEHAQGGVYEDIVFGVLGQVNAGGACIQVAMRNVVEGGHDYSMEMSPEAVALAMQESTRVYRRLTSNHVGYYPSGRWGAFALVSEHYPQLDVPGVGKVSSVPHNIVIEDCKVVAGHINYVDGNGKLVRSPRQILVQGRKSLLIKGGNYYVPDPHDGWFGRVNDVDHVTLDGPHVEGGRLEITNPKSVEIRGGSGTLRVQVVVAGQTIHDAPITQAFAWTAPVVK